MATRAPKVTAKPMYTEAIPFGSLEHRKLAAEHHHGLVPWQVVKTDDEAQSIAKRVRLADQHRMKRGEIVTARSVCIAKLADGSNGYGVFFLPTAQKQ